MASIKKPQIDEAKLQDPKYLEKAKAWCDRLGMSLDEFKEKKITKNQLKKLCKRKQFDLIKKDVRKQKREKDKMKRRKLIESDDYTPVRFNKMESSPNKMRIVIDLSFEDLMDSRELQKTLKQARRCYSMNRRSDEPCQYYLTSFCGKIKDYFISQSVDRWDVHLVEEHWYDYFKSTGELSKVIFLTADSETTLPEAEELRSQRDDQIFIIGGLVDHNFHKNLTLKMAGEKGVKTAKLPISEHMRMVTSQVLAINQVFEIMLGISTGSSWKDCLNENVPLRKLAKPTCKVNEESSELDSDEQTNDKTEPQATEQQASVQTNDEVKEKQT